MPGTVLCTDDAVVNGAQSLLTNTIKRAGKDSAKKCITKIHVGNALLEK